MLLRRHLLAAAVACAPALALAQAQPPLRTAVDGSFAPHAMSKLGGGVEGFNVDLFTAVAKKMGREIVFDAASYSGLIPAMNAGRYDFLAAPTTVTTERAEAMLFTEGYLYTEFQFGIRRGTPPITSMDAVRGKVIAVNKGSAYDIWARANAEKYGFIVESFDTNPDAVQAVLAGRAFANLAGNTVIKYAATRVPNFVPDFTIRETRAHWAAPFRRDNVELRNAVENALECLKRDGTVARLSEKWFGVKPAADDAENTVFPGYGVPGMPGYDPTPHEPNC